MSNINDLNQEKLSEIANLTLNYSVGMTISASIYLGDKLGIYKAMSNHAAMTSLQLAEKLNLHERWIREWLHSQATAGLIEYIASDDAFLLSREAAKVLADDTNPYFQAGSFSKILSLPTIVNSLENSFKSGIGFGFDISGEDGAKEVERTFCGWYRSTFIDVVLPSLNSIKDKLITGIKVADVGCGSGIALIEMAKRFPNSKFIGYDISKHALSSAEKNKKLAKIDNVTFYNAKNMPLPCDNSFSLITAFDCLHDMSDPEQMILTIEKSLNKEGVFFLAEINTKNSFLENLQKNPYAKHLFSWSLLYCLPSSLSKSDGAGLGACDLSENKLKELLRKTNLTIYKNHDFKNPLQAYYEITFNS